MLLDLITYFSYCLFIRHIVTVTHNSNTISLAVFWETMLKLCNSMIIGYCKCDKWRFFVCFKWRGNMRERRGPLSKERILLIKDVKMTNVLALEVFIFLVLSACGRQPQNNWTVHVWPRQWCQFEYLIRCGASCLLVKSRQGFIGLFFCLFYIMEEIQPKGEQMSKTFLSWQLLNPNRNSILKSVFQAVLQGWLSYTRPIQIKFSSVSVCCNDTWRNHRTLT